MEVADFMELIKTAWQHSLPRNLEQIGAATASMCAARDFW
jgi:hypothetical protein